MATTLAAIQLRPWTRADRRALAAWPAAHLPLHWQCSGSSSGPRISYAITGPGSILIGRITLRDIQASAARLGIYLHPAWTGRGYGRQAMTQFGALAATAGYHLLRLDVAMDNQRAIRCYHRCGWKVVMSFCRAEHWYYEMQLEVAHASSAVIAQYTVVDGGDRGLCDLPDRALARG